VLLDLRVLRLGLLKDGDVGVGVFQEVEELLVFQPSFVLISSPCEAYARPSWRCVRAPIGVDFDRISTPGAGPQFAGDFSDARSDNGKAN